MNNEWIGLVIVILLALLLVASADALNRMDRIEDDVEAIAFAFAPSPTMTPATMTPPPVLDTPVQATAILTVTPPFLTPTIDSFCTATVTVGVNLRPVPGLGSGVIGSLLPGVVVEVDPDSIERDGFTWYRVEGVVINGVTMSGWIADVGLRLAGCAA
ncbi:MAG: SH3 domain-containing protein [Anaerolineae bacterium]|nr:SH3 domain-containing protein [Anaerolineae bacterium]